jgi:hypothetical protein
MIEKSSINSDLSLYLLSYSRCSHIKHSYIFLDSLERIRAAEVSIFFNFFLHDSSIRRRSFSFLWDSINLFERSINLLLNSINIDRFKMIFEELFVFSKKIFISLFSIFIFDW